MRFPAISWLAAGSLALLLAACGTPLHSPMDKPLEADAEPRNTCHVEAVQPLVGQVYDEQTLEQALEAAEADEVRLLRPDSIVTKEYKMGRLNMVVDDAGVIVRVYCG